MANAESIKKTEIIDKPYSSGPFKGLSTRRVRLTYDGFSLYVSESIVDGTFAVIYASTCVTEGHTHDICIMVAEKILKQKIYLICEMRSKSAEILNQNREVK